MKQHTITISKSKLKKKIEKYKKPRKRWSQEVYSFHIWTKEAFDFAHFKDKNKKKEDYSNFLDTKGFKELNLKLI